MSRKTIEIVALIRSVNTMLAESTTDVASRTSLCVLLENVLHDTGNYNGFSYLGEKQVPAGQLPGINSGDLVIMTMEQKFNNTDDTRRRYYVC